MNVHTRNKNYTINYDSSNVTSAQYSFLLPFINDGTKNKNDNDKAYLQIIHYNNNKNEQFRTTEKNKKTKTYIMLKQTEISLKKKKKKKDGIKEATSETMRLKKKVLNEKILKNCFYGTQKKIFDKFSRNNISASFFNMKTKETKFSERLQNSVNDEENTKKFYHLMKIEPDKCYNNIQYNILHLKKNKKKINKSRSQPLFDTKLKEMNILDLPKLKKIKYKNLLKKIIYTNSEVKAIQNQIKEAYNIKF